MFHITLLHNLPLLAGSVVLAFLLLLRYLIRYLGFRRKLHKVKQRNTVIPQYNAPIQMPPAFFGSLLDNRLSMKELAATLLAMHLKGNLKLSYNTQLAGFQITLLTSETQTLNRHEQYIVSVLMPHLYNSQIAASRIGEVFRQAESVFIFVVEQDLQIAGYYMFDKNMAQMSASAFTQAAIGRALKKGLTKPWNWPGLFLAVFAPIFGVAWLIIALVFYNRIGIYNYKMSKWEASWADVEGYYVYLREAEMQQRNYDLAQYPGQFVISQHDPYLVAAQLESEWMKLFGLGPEIGVRSNKDYKTM